MKRHFRSVTILQEKHRYMGSYTELKFLYDMNDVLDHEYEEDDYAKLFLIAVLCMGLLGALVGVGASAAFKQEVWSAGFFILTIGGFIVGAGATGYHIEDILITHIAKKDRRKKGKSLDFHRVRDEDWRNFLESLRR